MSAPKQPRTPQQGGTPAPASQQGQTTTPAPQQGTPVFKDWASI